MTNLYISNPMLVTAIRWDGQNAPEIAGFFINQGGVVFDFNDENDVWLITTPNGVQEVNLGDWVIKNSVGDFFAAVDELFRSGFTSVDNIVPK